MERIGDRGGRREREGSGEDRREVERVGDGVERIGGRWRG